MLYRALADMLMVVHLAFVLFVVLGGLLVLRRPSFAWLHFPAFVWGTLIELTGWICPLTPLENYFRRRGGEDGYESGFIEHYIVPVLYPDGLTRLDQLVLGGLILVLNLAVYCRVIRIWQKRHSK